MNKHVYLNDPTGNNNSKADYGETISMDVTLINYGNSPDPNVYAILSSADTCITITDSIATWGYIAANDTSFQANAFTCIVKNYIPDQHKVMFNLSVRDSSANIWNSPFNINLNAPEFNITNIAIDDITTGNGNGWLDPGETVEFSFTTCNSGHSDALNTIGMLSSPSPQITVNTSNHYFNTLSTGVASDAVFSVTLDASAGTGNYINLDYVVNSGLFTRTENYQIMIGPAMEDWETGAMNKFHWVNDLSNPWTLSSVNPYEGTYAAKSGNIGNMETTQLSVSMNIISSGNISFYRKVSSEDNYDYLEFYIDGTLKGQWSGEVSWALETYPVTTGVHTFKWVYNKDIYVNNGSDCGWIDYINFPPFANILTTVEEQISPDIEFNCYPNPANDIAYVSFNNPTSGKTDIEFFNMLGEKVSNIHHGNLSARIHKFIVPVNQLEHGIYLIVLHTERTTKTFKLIVTH